MGAQSPERRTSRRGRDAFPGRDCLPGEVAERVAGLGRTIVRAAFLERLFSAAVWVSFAAGIFVLAVRTALYDLAPYAVWAWLALPASAALACALARLRAPSAETLLVLSERLGRGGGLLLAVAETADPLWAKRLPESLSRFPYPRIRGTRAAAAPIGALLFLGAAFLVPQRRPEPAKGRAFAEILTARIEEQISLAEPAALRPEETEELRSALDRLREEMAKKVDAATLEAANELAARLAERVLEAERALARIEEEASAGAGEGGSRGPGLAPEKLGELARSAAGRGLVLDAASKELLDRALAPEEAHRLSEEEARRLARNLAKASQAKRRDLSACKRSLASRCRGGACLGFGEKAASLLAERGEGSAASRDGEKGGPGRGGVTRGFADAPLAWGKEAEPGKFREAHVPANFIFETDTDLAFESLSAPEVEPEEGGASAARERGPASGAPREAQRIGPRRLEAVRRYFGGGAR